MLSLGAIALAKPDARPVVPQAGSPPAMALLVSGALCLAVLVHRACAPTRSRTAGRPARGRRLRLARRLAVRPARRSGPAPLGFYGGHALELGGIALIGIPTALDLARGGASRPLVGDLTPTELVAAEEAFLGPRVRALLVRLAERDTLDRGAHAPRRAARRARRRGAQAPCRAAPRPRRRRAAARHRQALGAAGDPAKPGPLDDEEFAEIRRHPDAGRRLLEELGGFPETVERLVSDHHERLDGTGYPRGLQGCDLSIETRILAACDVYDALVSDRVYRAAWTPERALALLHEEAGTGYDRRSSRRSSGS